MGATHDWSRDVDLGHVREIQAAPERYAPGGVLHLVLEALAYPLDEVVHGGADRVVVTLHRDGSYSVGDNGRGTEMRYDESGRGTRKPVMGTRDLRFFGLEGAPALPDGHPRSGMSVVTSLSEWLTHTTSRDGRGWAQRYERGVPVGALTEVAGSGASGTTVRFRPDRAVFGTQTISIASLEAVCAPMGAVVDVELVDDAADRS